MRDFSACAGCRDNFYNGRDNVFGRNCVNLKSARMVKRWRLEWWTSPVEPSVYQEVKVPNCYHQPGQYAYFDKLPSHAVDPVRMSKKKAVPHE